MLHALGRQPFRPLVLLSWAAVFSLAIAPAAAEPVFFGPTPYRSAADSPFDLSGLGTTFFLEDFEDGALNTPGIFQDVLPAAQATVVAPSMNTDSVDGDAGGIDGIGSDGHSLRSMIQLSTASLPPTIQSLIGFSFDSTTLGFAPDTFGLVWTDGMADSLVIFDVSDVKGNTFRHVFEQRVGDSLNDGQTDEDRFIGVRLPAGISQITIISSFRGLIDNPPLLEVDHIQYGLAVPEPTSFGLLAIGILSMVGPVARRHD